MLKTEEILNYFPSSISQMLFNLFQENGSILTELQEIRFRTERPIILKLRKTDLVLQYETTQSEILQIVERLCENSIYAYKNQICEGFITVKGGHRVGITGSCVIDNGKINNIKYISSLNFRIAREVLNCSEKLLPEIIDKENNTINNTVLVAPPGKGKNNNAT